MSAVARERVVSLFDVDDVTEFGPVRDYVVTRIGIADVEEFCRRWHYTRYEGAANWRYGIWDDMTLVGVVAYNNPNRDAAGAVFGPDFADRVAHMGRLVCADDAPRNTESRLIGASLALLKCDRPDLMGVLTYAAQDQGHIGYVYQATNAIYTGMGRAKNYYLDAQGRRHEPRHPSGRAGAPDITPIAAMHMGWTVHRALPKHRYVYLLGNKTERREARALLRFPVLPYPKAVPS